MSELKRLLLEWAADFDGAAEYAPTRLEKVVLKTRAEECRKQAAREQEGGEAVAEVELSDYIHLAGAVASQRKALKELSEGSIQSLDVGTKLYTRSAKAQGVPEANIKAAEAIKAAYEEGFDDGMQMHRSDFDECWDASQAKVAYDALLSTTPQPSEGVE